MKKTPTAIGLALLLAGYGNGAAQSTDEEAIRTVIQEAYIDGLENLKDLDKTRAGFHPKFVLLTLRDGEMTGLPIAEWIASAEKRKAEGQEPRGTVARFPSIDITTSAAVARVELYRDSEFIFTDYLSLYKFDDGWKIVGKIFYQHD